MDIAILSQNEGLYSTRALYRAGVQRGRRMMVIDHTRCNLVVAYTGAEVYYEEQPLGRLDAIIPRIGSSATLSGAAVISHFELMGVFTAARAQSLLQARDKLRCLQVLTARGLAAPRTAFVAEGEDPVPLVASIGGLPVVIKLMESTHGVGIILAESMQAVISTIEAFHRLRGRVIMQEFVREAGGADFRALIVDGQVVAAMKRQAPPHEFRSNLHRGASAHAVTLADDEREMALRAAEVMGLDVAGVDLLRSARGPLLMEVNASPGLEGIETVTGVDIAAHLILYIEKKVEGGRG
jgi:ribosomal protein S6--L-glutamate ligase